MSERGANERPDEAQLYERAGAIFDEVADLAADDAMRALADHEERDAEAARLARRLVLRDRGPALFGLDEGALDESDPAGVLGAAIGPFRVEEFLGRGGMGAVYLGRRDEPEERVAIKFVTLSAAPAFALERFRSETRYLASVEHPGIVRYRDSGVDRRGRPYLVMDFVDGEPASSATPEIAESVRHTVAIAVRVAEAVHHLHQRRILHRDLKPSNVMLRRDGRHGPGGALEPIIIDFGIARALALPGSAETSGTLGLGPVGTPAFMSPEQSRPDAPQDVRTDVHALGAFLYALLTGHPPRDLDREGSDDPIVLHRRLRETEARAPSERVAAEDFGRERARRRARQIDRDLDAIVLKALALEPDQRYGSAEAFAADLKCWLDRMPVAARMPSRAGRARRWVLRHPWESIATAATALILAGSTAAALISRSGEIRERRRYEEQLAITESVNTFFTEEVFANAVPEAFGPEAPVIEVLRSAARGVGDRLDERPALGVAMRSTLLSVFERLGALEEADEQLEKALVLVRDLPADHPQRLRFELEHGTLLLRRNRYDEAEPVLRGVLARLAEDEIDLPEVEAMAANALGVVYLSKNELDAAEPWLARALDGLSPDDPRRFEVQNNQVLLAWSRGDREQTLRALERMLPEVEARFPGPHPYTMGVSSNLALLHLDRHDPEQALPYARRAVEIAEEIHEPTHVDRLSTVNQLASCLSQLGQHARAIELRHTVLEGRRERLGPDNPAVGEALVNLAMALIRDERPDEAAPFAEEAVAVLERVLGDANPSTASACLTLAAAKRAQGRSGEAVALADRAIGIYRAAAGDHSSSIADTIAWRDEVPADGAASDAVSDE